MSKNKNHLLTSIGIAGVLTLAVALVAQPLGNKITTIAQNNNALTEVSDLSAATVTLQNKLPQFESLAPSEKTQVVEQAKLRRKQIKDQLDAAKNDPQRIADIYNQLTAEHTIDALSPQSKADLAPFIEQSTQISGIVAPGYVDYDSGSEYTYTITTSDGKKTLQVYSTTPLSEEPSQMNITGKAFDDSIITTGSSPNSLTSVTQTEASTTFKAYGTLGVQIVLVPLPGFAMKDLYGTDITEDNVYSQFMTNASNVKKYFEFATYYPNGGKSTTVNLQRADVITIPYNKTPTSCDYLNWSNYADTKLSTTQLSKDRIVYVFPRMSTLCINAASQATLNGYGQLKNRRTWFFGNTTIHVLAHEFSHNAGAHHAMAMYCGDHQFTSFSDSACKWAKNQSIANSEPLEYADMYDNMGGGGKYTDATKTISRTNAPDISAIWKKQLGWLSSSRTTSISTSTATKNITLLPLDTYASSGYQQIKIAATKFSTNSNWYVEFRRPVGYDNVWPINKNTAGGILIRLYGDNNTQVAYGSSTAIPAILDPITPFNADYNDRIITTTSPTTRFVDPINKVVIKLLSTSTAAKANVCIGVGDTTNYCK